MDLEKYLKENNDVFTKVMVFKDIELNGVSVQSGTGLSIKQNGETLQLATNHFNLSVTKEYLSSTTGCTLNELFISEEDIKKALKLGSEVYLMNDLGIGAYTVEQIDFKNNAYATIYVKIS